MAAALIDRAIGKQLTSIFVDNGLLRQNERNEVIKLFNDHIPGKLKVAKADRLFLGKLKAYLILKGNEKSLGKPLFKYLIMRLKNSEMFTFWLKEPYILM